MHLQIHTCIHTYIQTHTYIHTSYSKTSQQLMIVLNRNTTRSINRNTCLEERYSYFSTSNITHYNSITHIMMSHPHTYTTYTYTHSLHRQAHKEVSTLVYVLTKWWMVTKILFISPVRWMHSFLIAASTIIHIHYNGNIVCIHRCKILYINAHT